MDQELIEQIQEITEFKLYRLWGVGNSKSKGSWASKKYTRKQDLINQNKYLVGKKQGIIVIVSSLSPTQYEWL